MGAADLLRRGYATRLVEGHVLVDDYGRLIDVVLVLCPDSLAHGVRYVSADVKDVSDSVSGDDARSAFVSLLRRVADEIEAGEPWIIEKPT